MFLTIRAVTEDIKSKKKKKIANNHANKIWTLLAKNF